MNHIKLVIVGDGAIGKTSLLISYASGGFPRDYQPTVFDNFSAHHIYQGKPFLLGLWDTAGQEDFDRLRPLGYNSTDVFLICYSVVNPPSYANVYDKWLSEISHYTNNTPIVLVGTQIDLRTDKQILETLALKQQDPISFEEGLMMKKKIGAMAFAECSVETMKGVKQVFEESIKVYLDYQRDKGSKRHKRSIKTSKSKNISISSSPSSISSSPSTTSTKESNNCILF